METKHYSIGFILSVILTLLAFGLVSLHKLAPGVLIAVVLIFAFIQLGVQLTFFLHLDQKSERQNLFAIIATAGSIFILVGASIWIMNNLNSRHMSNQQTDQYIEGQEGIYK